MAKRVPDSEFGRTPRRRSKLKWRYLFGFAFIGLIVLIVLLPTLVVRRSILLPLINQFAGITPLKLELETIQAGWLTPVRVTGLQVMDSQGHMLARVGQVQTDKSLVGWIGNSSHLGTIHVEGVEAAVVVYDGTTNIEEALKPLLDQMLAPSNSAAASKPAQSLEGTIEVVDSKFLLMEQGRPEQWVMAVPKLTIALPSSPSQMIGPIEMQATMADVSGTVLDSTGTLAASVEQTEGSQTFQLRATVDHVPVDFWHVVHARLPELPILEMHGRISASLAGNIVDAESWNIDVQRLETTDLQIVAPELVGQNPAKLAMIAATGRASLSNAEMKIENAQLACDFSNVSASATLPWPLALPTAQEPFFAGGTLAVQGSVDLPKLVRAAETLLPLREGTQLLDGTAQFAISQQLNGQGAPTSRAKLQLTGLRAVASGQELKWNDPLTIELAADQGAPGLQIGAMASAEFFNLKAGGTIQTGQVAGNVDLDLLQQRLSQYIELPIRTMQGSAEVDIAWNMTSQETLVAEGKLTTTPLVIASTTGGQIQEPAWNGNFDASAQLLAGVPQQISRAHLSLKSPSEQLTVDLQEPFSLVASPPGGSSLPPAAFSVNLDGNLANWKRRGTMWLAEPPELEVAGNLSIAVNGRIDLAHVEILQANWRSQPLEVSTPQVSFSEPQMVGNFKGRVDTNDLTRLVVEKLEVQSTSFSLGARDSANADGSGSRVGQAMFLVDLDRLLKSMNSRPPTAVIPPPTKSSPPATQYAATGRVQGQLAWQVSPQAAAFNVTADGESIVITSRESQAAQPTRLWDEPKVTTVVNGNWLAETGALRVDSLEVKLPWMNYAGNLAYRMEGEKQIVQVKGQAVYDSVQLTNKITPMTGNQVQLFGQQTVPIDITWTGSNDPNRSVFAGLQATTRMGWEQARVAGIVLGKADVPVTVTDGLMATAAEFPVSGGKLRWDVTSDLTADNLVLLQKPMTVLENVEITKEMCDGWLKYVTPLLAGAASVDGRLSLQLNQAKLTPADPMQQTVAGQLIVHNAQVGPGPLSNQIIAMVKQIDAIRKKDYTQAVSSQKVWMNMPEQRIDFQMVNGRVNHQNLNVRIGDATISTSGGVGVDGQLDMTASMPIPDNWVEKTPLLASLRGQSLQFPVRGTLKEPQMDTQFLQQFGTQAVQSAANGLLQQGLSRGLGKLFGNQPPPPPATPPAGQ